MISNDLYMWDYCQNTSTRLGRSQHLVARHHQRLYRPINHLVFCPPPWMCNRLIDRPLHACLGHAVNPGCCNTIRANCPCRHVLLPTHTCQKWNDVHHPKLLPRGGASSPLAISTGRVVGDRRDCAKCKARKEDLLLQSANSPNLYDRCVANDLGIGGPTG